MLPWTGRRRGRRRKEEDEKEELKVDPRS